MILEDLWGSHPKVIPSGGTAAENRTYCTKDATDIVEHGTPMRQGKRSDLESVAAAVAGGSSIQDLWENSPVEMIKFSRGITELYSRISPNIRRVAPKLYSLDQYPQWTMNTSLIQNAMKERTVILWGPSGVGKTCYARALLPRALFVTHMDDLTKYDEGVHDGIIFDDISIQHLPREAQIQILDFEQPRSIHVRYTTAYIPPETKKIFTTNNQGGWIYKQFEPALDRRVHKFHLDGESEYLERYNLKDYANGIDKERGRAIQWPMDFPWQNDENKYDEEPMIYTGLGLQ